MNKSHMDIFCKISFYLVMIGLALLPFDAVPILPSVYRPISILFFFVALIILLPNIILNLKFDKSLILVLILYIYSISTSVIFSKFKYNNFIGTKDFIITFTLGILTFIPCNYIFKLIRKNSSSNEAYLNFTFEKIFNGYSVAFFIGILQVFYMIHIMPGDIIQMIGNIVSGSTRIDRVKMVSFEPSWGSMQLIFIIPILMYLKDIDKKYYKFLIVALILFLFTFSMQGFVTLAASWGIYLFFYSRNKLLYFFKLITFGIILIVLYSILYIFGSYIFSGAYFMQYFQFYKYNSLYNFLLHNGSAYIRIILPVVGVLIFLQNPFLGIGGGNYRIEFNSYLLRYFPEGINNKELFAYMIDLNTNPRNLYIRILCEMGIVGFILFVMFIKNVIHKLTKPIKNKNIVIFWIISVLTLFVQFDSIAYVNLWVCLAIINNLR